MTINSSSSWLGGSESVCWSWISSGTLRYLLYESVAPLPYSNAIFVISGLIDPDRMHADRAIVHLVLSRAYLRLSTAPCQFSGNSQEITKSFLTDPQLLVKFAFVYKTQKNNHENLVV